MFSKLFHAKIPLKGARILITGGGSGIGRLMAIGAAVRGARPIVWDISEAGAEVTADMVRQAGGECATYRVDLSSASQIAEVGKQTLVEQGRVDILINCAGIVTGRDFLDISDGDLELIYGINTLALYRTTRVFLPGMLRRNRGVIVNIASAAGFVGVARQTDYSGTKAAALMFTEALRAELNTAGSKVRTLTVCPYYIDTGMFEGARGRFEWLLPTLKQEDVATGVLDAIQSGRHLLVIPEFSRISPLMLAVIPTTIRDIVSDFLGVSKSMEGFTGRG